jgi:hypothetical protein
MLSRTWEAISTHICKGKIRKLVKENTHLFELWRLEPTQISLVFADQRLESSSSSLRATTARSASVRCRRSDLACADEELEEIECGYVRDEELFVGWFRIAGPGQRDWDAPLKDRGLG